jgi:hypothetical protein
MACAIPQRASALPFSEREPTSVVRALERSDFTARRSSLTSSLAGNASNATMKGHLLSPEAVAPPLSESVVEESDAWMADPGPHLNASFDARAVRVQPRVSRALVALVVAVGTTLVAAEGFRRISHIERWADVPGVASVSSTLRTYVPFMQEAEDRGRVQPIKTASPNVVEDALQNASTRPSPSTPAAEDDSGKALAVSVPMDNSDGAPAAAGSKTDAVVAPSETSQAASLPAPSAETRPSEDARGKGATAASPSASMSSALRKSSSATSLASRVDRPTTASRTRRTDGTGVVTSASPRNAERVNAAPRFDRPAAPASGTRPSCTASVAALGLCSR